MLAAAHLIRSGPRARSRAERRRLATAARVVEDGVSEFGLTWDGQSDPAPIIADALRRSLEHEANRRVEEWKERLLKAGNVSRQAFDFAKSRCRSSGGGACLEVAGE
eukprot:13714354-Alexandrium_andersonii.AAC.1